MAGQLLHLELYSADEKAEWKPDYTKLAKMGDLTEDFEDVVARLVKFWEEHDKEEWKQHGYVDNDVAYYYFWREEETIEILVNLIP